ncbi:unnamed protein product [Adineta ricciae]|uniref:Uncharacterized protein n=1 Tax=Adineta ricciae TaxID=249248 RepID=A0A815ZHY3_ADIRI|nr:unnamed protein product [Adineta ricciae]
MLIDDQLIDKDQVQKDFSSIFRQNVIEQAASMLLQHVTLNQNVYRLAKNSNGNALDEYHYSSNSVQKKKKDFRRTNKCYSWLSKFPSIDDESFHKSSHRKKSSDAPSKLPPNQMTLSTNAVPNDVDRQTEAFSQPFIMVHKKRFRREDFLSTMQNCIQPPYSQNHFYALDQVNMLKLQRSFRFVREKPVNFKRKYSDHEIDFHCSEMEINQRSPFEQSLPKTADHISINKYHQQSISPSVFDNQLEADSNIEKQKPEESHVILSRLEKILDLCGELRTIAKDVELHLNEHSISKTTSIEINEHDQQKELDSEQTVIDIYKELEQRPAASLEDAQKRNTPPQYQSTHDTLSMRSESDKSIQLMQSESFKTKSPSAKLSQAKLRSPAEDICSCFLKSFLEKENCQLTSDEQEYLNELTRAYILGREQLLQEQQEAKNKAVTSVSENLCAEESEEHSSSIYDTNNNNQLIEPSSILLQTTTSMLQSTYDNQPLLSTPSEVISLKHEVFLQEPIAMKTISVLPGIGKTYAEQLEECGFSTVRRLLGFYLMIKDDQHFVIWLNSKAGISLHSAWLCTYALRSWCQTHL